MSFGEWQAYAGTEDFGRSLALHIGREVAPNRFETITEIGPSGTVVCSEESSPEATTPPIGLRLDLAAGEALYGALHRVFGNSDPKGTEDALKVERARVEKVLDRLLEVVK